MYESKSNLFYIQNSPQMMNQLYCVLHELLNYVTIKKNRNKILFLITVLKYFINQKYEKRNNGNEVSK